MEKIAKETSNSHSLLQSEFLYKGEKEYDQNLCSKMPLIEPMDMVRMGNKPDLMCVFTYVQSLYRTLMCIEH